MHRCTANVKDIALLSNKCLNIWDPTAEGESLCIFMCTAELGFFQVLYHLKVINNEGRHSTDQQKGENPKWPPRWSRLPILYYIFNSGAHEVHLYVNTYLLGQ